MNQTPAGGDRLEIVDILRGFALTGLFLVHMIESFELYWADPREEPISNTVYLLFMGKSFSMLALCFGFSFFILMDRAARRGEDFTARFAWRLAVLFAIGTIHSWMYRGDIIQLLAGMGFVLLLFHRVKDNRVLLAIAAFCFLQPVLLVQLFAAMAHQPWADRSPFHFEDPAMKVYLNGTLLDFIKANLWSGQWPKWWFMVETGRLVQILGLYLVGMLLGRIGFFARLGEFARARKVALAIAAGLTVFLYFARDPAAAMFAAQGHGMQADRIFRYTLGSWFELVAMTTWVLVLIALYRSVAGRLLAPFVPMGRLTLTFYIAQSLVFIPVFYGFGLGLWDDWDQATRLVVALGAVAAQMAFAAAWLKRFHYGPLEWVWRRLTYFDREVPLRRVAG